MFIFHSSSSPNPDFSDSSPYNSDSEYEISEILDSCIDKRHKCKLLYLVKWAGYEGTDEETS